MPDRRAEPVCPALVERVLSKLGFGNWPPVDLAGLTMLFAAYSGSVPFDNIRKRIWFAGDRTGPLPDSDPDDFFEHWLAYGTGGTCWPSNGALCALLQAVGFDSQRIAGSVLIAGLPGPEHGSVVVRLEGVEYLVDGNFGAFAVLPLTAGVASRTATGINEIRAVPHENGWDVLWYSGHNREQPFTFRLSGLEALDHQFFVQRYQQTIDASPFNESLYAVRRFRESIVTIGRNNKIVVNADGSFLRTHVGESERRTALIEELGIAEEIAMALPPDVAWAIDLF